MLNSLSMLTLSRSSSSSLTACCFYSSCSGGGHQGGKLKVSYCNSRMYTKGKEFNRREMRVQPYRTQKVYTICARP